MLLKNVHILYTVQCTVLRVVNGNKCHQTGYPVYPYSYRLVTHLEQTSTNLKKDCQFDSTLYGTVRAFTVNRVE